MLINKKFAVLGGLLVIVALVLAACASPSSETHGTNSLGLARNAHGYADIDVHGLAELLETEDLFLVNVHIPYEGELANTDAFVPYNEIADHLDALPARDEPILVYCRSGPMSTSAARELAELGYTEVIELNGGFMAWTAAGYELLYTQ
jgi:rhodanese-related sulfurtransferase